MKINRHNSVPFLFFIYFISFGTVVIFGTSLPICTHMEGEILCSVKMLSVSLSGLLFCALAKFGLIRNNIPPTRIASLILLGYFHNMTILCYIL